jgi:hypothetical protein
MVLRTAAMGKLKANDHTGARCVLARLHAISEIFQDGNHHTVQELALHFEVCTKTIYRDLDWLKTWLEWDFDVLICPGGGHRLRSRTKPLLSIHPRKPC